MVGKFLPKKKKKLGRRKARRKFYEICYRRSCHCCLGQLQRPGQWRSTAVFFSKNEKRNGTCRLAEFGVWKNEKTKKRRIHLFFLNCYMSFFNTCSWVSLTRNILAAKVVEPEGRLKQVWQKSFNNISHTFDLC